MKIAFHINYRTNWGESLYLAGNFFETESHDNKCLQMFPEASDSWTLVIEIPNEVKSVSYNYLVKSENTVIRTEINNAHNITLRPGSNDLNIYDSWQESPLGLPFHSDVFRRNEVQQSEMPLGSITLHVNAPILTPEYIIAISGESEILGEWNPQKALRLHTDNFPYWEICFNKNEFTPTTQFKFLILDARSGELASWEDGENRTLGAVHISDSAATVVSGLRYNGNQHKWKGAGVAIPVFSLRTEDDFGVGDFLDLIKLVDWAKETGLKFIQVLPINDTTMSHSWMDSYPYNANSTFALHPMYIRLQALGTLKNKSEQEYFNKLAIELNQLTEVDYVRVNNGKNDFLRKIYAQEGHKTINSSEFKNFVAKNAEWLLPYAAYCTLRDKFGSSCFSDWGKYTEYSTALLYEILKEYHDEIDYVCYIQFHLDKQMKTVHEYAKSKGIALKGDIPIGISGTSADAWVSPSLFNLDCQAGAPPDDFSVLGQIWGFPTYNWSEMSLDNYAWWKARFQKMAEYFDAYRIDHILGFFRIWEIPNDAVHGLLGHFNPAIPYTKDELADKYGFNFDHDLHTKPYITKNIIQDIFKENCDSVISTYFEATQENRYVLTDNVSTQRKVVTYFEQQEDNEQNPKIREGILSILDNVLFIEDRIESNKYHPRIAAQNTSAYQMLNDKDRESFNRLYNDFYYVRHNNFWRENALQKLPPLIQSTGMLVCAEDLGMIPACVPSVMQQLEVLSLEIQRMPKEMFANFGNTQHYPYYSVCTTSTHDMSGIRQWWEEDYAKTQQFYNKVLNYSGNAPRTVPAYICEQIIEQHLDSPSMLCILPIQDWLSISEKLRRKNPSEERINIPAKSRHYWRYRLHLTVEDLIKQKDFNELIRLKVKQSGR